MAVTEPIPASHRPHGRRSAADRSAIGRFAKGVASRYAPGIAEKILGRKPTNKEIEFVVQRLVNYLSANSAYWAKRGTGLDKEKDHNWWLMLLTPAVGEVAVELSKEQSLNRAAGEHL